MKAMQKCDISMNTIKNNYIFSDFVFPNFNGIALTSLFQEQLKYADVKPYFNLISTLVFIQKRV